jgi:hypothetical protein
MHPLTAGPTIEWCFGRARQVSRGNSPQRICGGDELAPLRITDVREGGDGEFANLFSRMKIFFRVICPRTDSGPKRTERGMTARSSVPGQNTNRRANQRYLVDHQRTERGTA